MTRPQWRRTEAVFPDMQTHADDWTLVAENGDRQARLWNTQSDDLLGSWRWRLWINHKLYEGSAYSGAEAKQACETLLAQGNEDADRK